MGEINKKCTAFLSKAIMTEAWQGLDSDDKSLIFSLSTDDADLAPLMIVTTDRLQQREKKNDK